MAKELNLLPEVFVKETQYYKLAKIIYNIAISGTIVISFAAIIALGVIFFNSQRTKNLNSSVNKLTASVKSMQNYEQLLVLAKDRVSKVKDIVSGDKSLETISLFESFYASLPSNVEIDKLSFSQSQASFSFLTKDLNSLAQMMVLSSTLAYYDDISLRNFSYSPETGYSASIETAKNEK